MADHVVPPCWSCACEKDLLDSIGVQRGVQVVKTLHPLCGLQVVRDHVLSEDTLHQQPERRRENTRWLQLHDNKTTQGNRY